MEANQVCCCDNDTLETLEMIKSEVQAVLIHSDLLSDESSAVVYKTDALFGLTMGFIVVCGIYCHQIYQSSKYVKERNATLQSFMCELDGYINFLYLNKAGPYKNVEKLKE